MDCGDPLLVSPTRAAYSRAHLLMEESQCHQQWRCNELALPALSWGSQVPAQVATLSMLQHVSGVLQCNKKPHDMRV